MDGIIAACGHKDVVRALFSATLPEKVEELARWEAGKTSTTILLASLTSRTSSSLSTPIFLLQPLLSSLLRSVLQQPLRVTIGVRNSAATTVRQRLLFVGREEGKLLALRQLVQGGLKPPVLVFVNNKASPGSFSNLLLPPFHAPHPLAPLP